jgi:hypothetical protein
MDIYKKRTSEERRGYRHTQLHRIVGVLVNIQMGCADMLGQTGRSGGSEISVSRRRLEKASDQASRQTLLQQRTQPTSRFTAPCGVRKDRGRPSAAPDRPTARPNGGDLDGSLASSR